VAVWEHAASDPLVFNGFAIPEPTTPNNVLVHNWTYSSIALAKSAGMVAAVDAAIDRAAQNPLLTQSIQTGRAVRLSVGDNERFDETLIRSETKDGFYAALGQRLLLLRDLDNSERQRVGSLLTDCCLRHGPEGLDAAVFLAAERIGVRIPKDRPDYIDYLARLRSNRTTANRFAIAPLVQALVS